MSLLIPMHCTILLDNQQGTQEECLVILFKNYWEAYSYEVFVCMEEDGMCCPVRFATL